MIKTPNLSSVFVIFVAITVTISTAGAGVALGANASGQADRVEQRIDGLATDEESNTTENSRAVLGPGVKNLTRQPERTVTVLIGLEQAKTQPTLSSQATVASLKAQADRTQKPVIDAIHNRFDQAEVQSSFWLSNTLVVETASTNLEEIARIPHVESIHKNREVSLLDPVDRQSADLQSDSNFTYGLRQINAPDAYEKFENRGEGVKVAVIDTGVDPDHPDIDIKSENFAEFNGDGTQVSDPEVRDTSYHGTHVSGTVVGGNSSGTQIGVAPNATLMHAVGIPEGTGSTAQIIASMEWAVENGADILSMSLGGSIGPDFIDAIENADDAGVIVVAASGNAGPQTSGSPASEWTSFSVGATNETGQVADFSSGQEIFTPEMYDEGAPEHYPARYIVPDHVAPGAAVVSAYPLDQSPGDPYRKLSGTSMATPHVSGALAVALSNSEQELSPDELYNLLTATARNPQYAPDEQDIRYGHGIVDLHALTDAVVNKEITTISGEVVGNSSGESLPGSTVTIRKTGERVEVGLDGTYELPTIAEGQVTVVANTHPAKQNKSVTIAVPDEYRVDFEVEQNKVVIFTEFAYNSDTRPYPRIVGQSTQIRTKVLAWGGRESTQTIGLYVDGERRDEQTVSLADGETETVRFYYTPKEEDRPVAEYEIRSANDSSIRDGLIVEEFAGGNGSATNPYLITSVSQFYGIASRNVYPARNKHFKIINNIDMSGKEWTQPIIHFGGTLNGNGHTLKNLSLFHPETTPGGLFRNLIGNGTIRDLHMENASIVGGGQTGGLVGIVWHNASIRNSSFNGTVRGVLRVGGVAGSNWGTISRTAANVQVHARQSAVGGLVGTNTNDARIVKSFSKGTVTAKKVDAGGLVGYNSESRVSDSYSRATVSASNTTGGLVGTNQDGVIERTFATGNVTGTGQVTATGGLVGLNRGGSVDSSYWDIQKTTQNESQGGAGLSTAQMSGEDAADNLAGFDFEETWMVSEQYPRLRWENEMQEPATFDLTYDVDATTVEVDEEVTVTATVKNKGDVSGSTTVNFSTDGTEFYNETVTVDGGNSTTVAATTSFTTTGTHNVTVENLAATNITVEQASVLEQYDMNNNGLIDDPEVLTAIFDWRQGNLGDSKVLNVIEHWRTQESFAIQLRVPGIGISPLDTHLHLG